MKYNTKNTVQTTIVWILVIIAIIITLIAYGNICTNAQDVDTIVQIDTFTTPHLLNYGYMVGDCDGDGKLDIDDVMFLSSAVFTGGPSPIVYNTVVQLSIRTDTLFVYKNMDGDVVDYMYKYGWAFNHAWYIEEAHSDSIGGL